MNDSFVFYSSWYESMQEEHTEEECAKLTMAICKYGTTGEKTFPLEKLFLKQCFAQIDAAKAKREQKVYAGRIGGSKSKQKQAKTSSASSCLSSASSCLSKTKQTQANVNVNANANKKGNGNNIYKKENKEKSSGSSTSALAGGRGAVSEPEEIDWI